LSITAKKIGVGLLLLGVALLVGLFRPGVPQHSSEAAIETPGGIFAAPSALPGLPTVIDQVIPAIAPAHGDGSLAVVGLACNAFYLGELCPDVALGEEDDLENVTFKIERAFPPGDPQATFVANGGPTLMCADDATCDVSDTAGVVAVQVTGGGVNEVVKVTATDESGDSRSVRIIFVETVFAVSPLNAASAISATLVSYNCPDIGGVPDLDWQEWLEDTYYYLDGVISIDFDPMADVGFYKCGGDTSSPVDDRVNFETDKGILTVEELADIDEGLADSPVFKEDAVTTECDAGDSVDVLDNPNTNAADDSQECDLDGAPNGVVTYGLLGTGDVGVASVTAQQSGGGGVVRTINVTFAGAAALNLFVDAPESVGTSGADFTTIILDQDGRPIPNETVECSVSPTGGALVIIPQTGTSDANGEVKFNLIPTGASVVAGEKLTITCFLDSNPDVKGTDEVTLSSTPQLESVALVEGCNPIAATWADGTKIETVAGAVAPAEALDAIWRFDPATGTWQAFKPGAPAAVNDLAEVDELDVIFICMSAAGTVGRPAK